MNCMNLIDFIDKTSYFVLKTKKMQIKIIHLSILNTRDKNKKIKQKTITVSASPCLKLSFRKWAEIIN